MKKSTIAFIGIIIENKENIPEINHTLSEFGEFIIGRLGVPHQKNKYNIISIIIDGSEDTINSLKERIERLDGIHLTVAYSYNK